MIIKINKILLMVFNFASVWELETPCLFWTLVKKKTYIVHLYYANSKSNKIIIK